MRFLSLFAGIGGIDAGFEAAGFECAGQVEIDPFCNLVLERHWPDVPRWLDVHDVSAESVRDRCGHIDLIAGGFPCQPHSVAGKRKGQSDERHLWPEFARLVREIRPRWVLAENVPGIRSTAADEVIGDLEAEGYTVWPLVVGADDVGAPHRRKRVWFVAHRGSDSLREQSRRCCWPCWSGEAVAGWRGEGLGDPKHDDRRADQPGRRPEAREAAGRSGADVAHGDGERGLVQTQRKLPAIEISNTAMQKARWPSRPGEPQHEWEEPRLDYTKGRNRHDVRRIGSQDNAQGDRTGTEPRVPQLPLGSSTDGVSLRLVRRVNREALKAYGNAVVPQVVYVIALAIDAVERRQA